MATDAKPLAIDVPYAEIEAFCRKWHVCEFSLFGSVLRDDFRPDSDIDVLITFDKDARVSLWDMNEMEEELVHLFGRSVDLLTKNGLRNPFRRHSILNNRRIVYAAG